MMGRTTSQRGASTVFSAPRLSIIVSLFAFPERKIPHRVKHPKENTMSKLHDELISEVGTSENVDDNMHSLMHTIADRIDACHGNRVKLSDLATILREDPKGVSVAVQKVTPVPVSKVDKETSDRQAKTDKDAADKAAADKKAADARQWQPNSQPNTLQAADDKAAGR